MPDGTVRVHDRAGEFIDCIVTWATAIGDLPITAVEVHDLDALMSISIRMGELMNRLIPDPRSGRGGTDV